MIDNTNVNRALHAQNVLIARQTQLIDRLQERMEQSQQQIEAQNQQIWRSQQQVEAQTQQIKRLADCFAQASHGTVHTAVVSPTLHTAALNIEPCITTPAAATAQPTIPAVPVAALTTPAPTTSPPAIQAPDQEHALLPTPRILPQTQDTAPSASTTRTVQRRPTNTPPTRPLSTRPKFPMEKFSSLFEVGVEYLLCETKLRGVSLSNRRAFSVEGRNDPSKQAFSK